MIAILSLVVYMLVNLESRIDNKIQKMNQTLAPRPLLGPGTEMEDMALPYTHKNINLDDRTE